MSQALLLIDIQNDYFSGGALELVGPAEAGAKAGALLGAFRDKKLPVVHIQHVSIRPGVTFFPPGTRGMEFHPSVDVHATALAALNGFFAKALPVAELGAGL